MMQESPLYVRTYDFLLWLIPQVQKFPRAHRFGLGERIQRLVLDFQDSLVAAGKAQGNSRQKRILIKVRCRGKTGWPDPWSRSLCSPSRDVGEDGRTGQT
ncbi:MAG: four helix bundle protein [Anaerolineales bacterium]|nr:four helix bundle protein [Anaerolineales bacterium]